MINGPYLHLLHLHHLVLSNQHHSLVMNVLDPPTRPQAGASSFVLDYSTDPSLKPSANAKLDAPQHQQEQHQDLWSSILNSVKSSKAISTKNIVLLGEPKSGKTSLLSALASTSPLGLVSGKSAFPPFATNTRLDDKPASAPAPPATSKLASMPDDLGLSYVYFDVGDEKDRDEIVARVGAYTLHSSEPAYTSLLPFAFPEPNSSYSERDNSVIMASLASETLSTSAAAPVDSDRTFSTKPSIDSLKESIVVILLDWEQPWTFLEHLRSWLSILSELVDAAADGALSAQQQRDVKWSTTRVALDEMKEQLEAYIRTYAEPMQKATQSSTALGVDQAKGAATATHEASTPSSADAFPAPLTSVSALLDGADANPLSEGTLTDNLGIPIVVVCTKADAIARLERDKDFKEEQFDYIQQVLRTICMKYGAALFYTSSVRAQSIDILRSYLLHRLFTPSSIGSQQQTDSGNSTAPSAQTSAAAGGVAVFGFGYRASTTDRDTLLVPAGWDSWGKIKALREPFDCRSIAKGWDKDCEVEKLRRIRRLEKTKQVEDGLEKELQAERKGDAPLDVAGGGDEVQSAMKLYEDIVSDWEAAPVGKDAANKVRIPDEQTFLGQHHASLQKDPDSTSRFSKRGVVGPMTGSSAGLPSVEKLMSREAKVDAAGLAQTEAAPSTLRPRLETSLSSSTSRRESTSAAAAAAVAAMTGGSADRSSRPTSPAVNSGTTSPGAPKQSEVLHSFFQSLLKDKASGVGPPKVDRLNRTSSTATSRRELPPK